jgi:hypothetical protein
MMFHDVRSPMVCGGRHARKTNFEPWFPCRPWCGMNGVAPSFRCVTPRGRKPDTPQYGRLPFGQQASP